MQFSLSIPKLEFEVEASIYMWQAFENSVASHAPPAEIVFDRFHISKHINEGVDTVRREEHRELMKEGGDGLKGMRYHEHESFSFAKRCRRNHLSVATKLPEEPNFPAISDFDTSEEVGIAWL